MKLFRLLAVLYVSTLAFFAKAQTNDWATYYGGRGPCGRARWQGVRAGPAGS